MIKHWFALLVCLTLACAAAQADSLTISLDSATLSGSPDDDLMFFGTLTNTSADTLYLNADNFNLTGLPPSSIDDSPFFVNAPISLGPGDSSGDIELFDITIPDGTTPGPYSGTFQVLGGADGNAQDVLGSATFTVQVQQNVGVVPEPSTIPAIFLLTGLVILAAPRISARPAS